MKSLLLLLSLFTVINVYSADFYWIGGGGDWSDDAHWSNTSGGPTVSAVPGNTDNVFFDFNSGLDSAAAIVIVDVDVAVADFHFAPNDGGLSATNIIITCNNFYSNNATSAFTLINTDINVSGSIWQVTNATGLNWTSTGSDINLLATNTTFSGGGIDYENVLSQSATLTLNDNNSFELLRLATSSTLTLENGSLQVFDSLDVSGTCALKTIINTPDVEDVPASLQKSGFQQFSASDLIIVGVNASTTGGYSYTLLGSAVSFGSGWEFGTGVTFYWIGDGGDWSDGNHWSYTSGGVPSGCVPYYGDSVIFDDNSFSLTGQEVLVDIEAFFSYMDWSLATNDPVWKLDTTVYTNGNITLNSGLFVTRTDLEHRIEFTREAELNTNNALLDCNISVYMDEETDGLLLTNHLVMTDSSGIYLLKGNIDFDVYDVTSGLISVFELPGISKGLDFGSSSISLSTGMEAVDVTNFSFDAGTSELYIGDTNKTNVLRTSDLIFNNVILDFIKTEEQQRLSGNNTFNSLQIMKGSDITIDSTSIQTIANVLTIQGTCKDSIYLSSTNTQTAYFQKATTANVIAECIHFTNIGAMGATQTALFSTGAGTNPDWILDLTPAVTAGFNVSGGFCLGDTTLFTNNSTVYSGNPNDMTSIWFFEDGSTGYYDYPVPGDSVWINYEPDTNKHVFISGGDFNVVLHTSHVANFCMSTDTVLVHISNPSVQVTVSDFDRIICLGEEVTFEVTSDSPIAEFQFYLNGVPVTGQSADDTLYVTTIIMHEDTVSVLSFENGCVSDTMPKIGFTVNNLPDFSWTSTDADTIICLNDNVGFSATALDLTYTYQYLLNGNPVFIGPNYSTSSLVDQDEVFLVATTTDVCRDTLSMIFDVRPLPTTSLVSSVAGNVICAGQQVDFTASGADQYEFFVNGASQGAPSATNSWSTTGLTTGNTVSVIGYSVDGCEKQANETFTYTVNPLPNVALSTGTTTICSGQSVLFNASGAAQYEFFINGVSVQGPSSVHTYSTTSLANLDNVYIEGSFSGCSNTSVPLVFSVATSPTTTLISDAPANTSCFQETVTFTAAGATNYEFLINGVSQGAPSTDNIFVTSSLTNGQLVTVNGESNGCVVSQSIPFTILPIPSVNLFSNDPDNIICQGETITFTGTNAVQYELFINGVSQGAPQASPLFTPTLPTGSSTVYVIGTAANGCTNISQNVLNVTVNPIPTIVLTSSDADNEICANESVTFTGSGSNLYQFFIDGISQGSMSATNTFITSDLLNGQNISIVGSSLGCVSNSNVLTFVVNPSPNVTLVSDDIDNIFCLGSNVLFTASGATNYEFFVDGVSQGTPSAVATLNASGFPTGTYSVEVFGEQSNCNGYASSTVTVNGLPTADIVSSDLDNTICSGESVTYTATGGVLYEFFINGVSQSSPTVLNAFIASSLNDGDGVSVMVTSPQGCSDISPVLPITVNPTPIVSLTSSDLDNEICVNESVTFTGAGADEYEFFINGISQGVSSPIATLVTSSLNQGDVVFVVGNSLGCEASSGTLAFTVNAYPVVNLVNNGNIQVCENEAVDLVASGALTYQYAVNGIPVGVYSPSPTFNGTVNNNDIVTVNGELNGCISTSASSIQYIVLPYPVITAISSDADNIICKDELVTFTVWGATEYVFELNGNTVQSSTSTTYAINTLETGDVIAVTGYNGHCASADAQFAFIVNEMNLELTAFPSNMICEGETVTFTATGADVYEFFLNGTSQGVATPSNTIVLSGLSDLDEITFVGQSTTTLCTQNHTDFILMNVMETPLISATSSYEFCDGDSVVLISNSPYGNQWLLDGNPIVGATDSFYVAYLPGVYSLDITHGGDGTIWSFGANASGTFGNGDNFNNTSPVQAITTTSFRELSSGADFVLGVTQTGGVYAWGKNDEGQLGNGTYTNSNLPVLLTALSNIKTVATAEASSMATSTAGDVYVWGENIFGQLGTGNTSVINFPYLNPALTNVDTVAAGKNHFLFLKNDGTVWATGYNASGQLGQGNLTNSLSVVQVAGLTNIVSIGAGENSSFAIDNAGNLYVWGGNGSGQLGLGDLTNRLTPALSTLKNIKNAEGGATHSAFVTTNNQLYTVGGNDYGQLGLGDNTDRTVPEKVNLGGIRQVSAGQYTTLVKRTDGSVFGFGDNSTGQLSTIGGATAITPTHLQELDGVVFIEAGRLTSHAIYGEQNTCATATPATVIVNTIPPVVITVTDDVVLSATTGGTSYQWYLDGLPIPGANQQIYTALTTGNYTVAVTFANGCGGTSQVQYIGFVGVEDIEASFKLVGYPNPANNLFNLGFDGLSIGDNITINIIDYTGRIVKEIETTIQSVVPISLTDFVSGSYQLVIKHTDFEKTLRFIKVD